LPRTTASLVLALTALSYSMVPVAGQSPAKPLTVEAIYGHGSLIGSAPGEFTWSPDGKHLTYMDGGELVDLDPASGKGHVLVSRAKMSSLQGAGGSEVDADHRARYNMASYIWSPDSAHLLFDSNGRLWLYDLHNGTGVEIGFSGMGSGEDPKFSPDGDCISFVRDHGLAVVRLKEQGSPVRMVAPAPDPKSGETVLNGEVDWLYLEELESRSNYFWSPDSSRIAYLQTNETQVPQYPRTDWIPTHAKVDMERYSQPGDPNPDVRVGVVSAWGGRTVWVKLPFAAGQDYIPRFGWADKKTLWIETVSRDQKHRSVYFADAQTGLAHSVLQLADDTFFDGKYDVFVGQGSIVLASWADGHSHIYRYSYNPKDTAGATAKLEGQLTQGEFEVSEILRVDAAGKRVFFASNEGGKLDKQLWQVGFDGQRKQLTSGAGSHEGIFAPGGEAFIDESSARMDPPKVRFCKTGGECQLLWAGKTLEPYHLRAPEEMEIKAHDGTVLYATLLLPEQGSAQAAPGSIPLIVNPYGGPGSQGVVNAWSGSLLFDELLAQHGFAVLHADNRGMGGRGRAYAQAAYHNFGAVQLEDQLTVLDAALARYPELDGKRLGWWGWSWGGSFTLYAMTHSDRFRAGVAVAPVTNWKDYDSTYTERYMSMPSEFAAGYKEFSVVNTAANLQGKLLLAQGTSDDNVHMENTVQFVQKLIEAGIGYDLQLYPGKTHSIAGGDVRVHLFNRILAHFEENLKGPGR